jgi:membrane-associated phospholipid phosphatase
MEALNNILFIVGEYSYLILIITTLALLINKKTLYYYYIFGLIINSILNINLKLLIRDPRPSPLKNTNAITPLKITHHIIHDHLTHFNIYGMPSGHAQMALFSTMYVWLACKNIKITLFYICISLITLYQRVKYNMHTIFQVVVGAIIGSLMGTLTFMFFKKKIVGVLNFKPDDNFIISSIGSNL